MEYRGNIVHLLHAGAFLLHDGGEDDPFLQGKAAVLQSRFVFLGQHLLLEFPQLGGDDIPCGGIGVEGVGLGIQEALQHRQLIFIGADILHPVKVIIDGIGGGQVFFLGAQAGFGRGFGHLEGIPALRQGEGHRFPVADSGAEGIDELLIAAALFQNEVAVLVPAVPTMGAAVQLKEGGIADQAGVLQLLGDGGGTAALRNGNGNGLAGFFAAVYLARHRDDPHRNEQQEEQQDDEPDPAFFVFIIGHSVSSCLFIG